MPNCLLWLLDASHDLNYKLIHEQAIISVVIVKTDIINISTMNLSLDFGELNWCALSLPSPLVRASRCFQFERTKSVFKL